MDEFTEGHYWAKLYAAIHPHTTSSEQQDAVTPAALRVLKEAVAERPTEPLVG